MADAYQTTATDTLNSLEERLARIEFAVNGHNVKNTINNGSQSSACDRLRALERSLRNLAARSSTVSDVLELHGKHPEIFNSAASSADSSNLGTAVLAQLVLAHEQLYKNTASHLSTLVENNAIADPSTLTKLIAMHPRINSLETTQKEQAKEFAELRARSARIVEQWYENGVLDMGEKWADWEERLRDCEISVRRREAAKRRDEATP